MKNFALAGIVALACTAPVAAAEFEAGDRGCLGYDAATHSCMSIQEVVSMRGNILTVTDRTILKLGRQPLTLLSRGSMKHEREGGVEGFCVDPAASDYRAEPKSHVYAAAMPNMIRAQMKTLGRMGHCVTHRFCGDFLIVDSFVGGVEKPSMKQVFRVFRRNDPKAAGLTGRETTVAQMARLGKVMPAGCEAGAT